MTTFDDRVQAFEAKFAHDLDLRFQARARCNKLLGLWAADILSLSDAQAESYASDVVTADLQHPGHDDVLNKILADMQAKNQTQITADDIKEQMSAFMTEACAEMLETT
ncbi:DUF1476 domain-containing protein [Pseudophaeobacter sp. EL27]|uniref:DUF1476 domain-containing protein n=1 Tax=Pseudophaeobacter sp. EL27 TaxID=2107580 RepID=UPI000EFC6529|nr:DUF1476 domain-containing protein [Pseudophaeobacter sp. EL27]